MHGKGFGRWRRQRKNRLTADKPRLCDIRAGDKARVLEIGGSEQFRIRLMELGLLVGDLVEVDKYAPLEDPLEIIVKGYHLSLRVEDAAKIKMELITE